MNIYADLLQGSEQWDNERRIRPTASRFKEIVTPKTGELSASAKAYAVELVTQTKFRANPDPADKWTGNAHTDNGHAREDDAAKEFERLTGHRTKKVGFVTDDSGFFGCSPDRLLIDYPAGGELKCPMSKTHAGWLLAGGLPPEHAPQVHGSMFVTGFREWFFLSHFPGLPPHLVHVKWSSYTDKLARAMEDFAILYNETRDKLLPKLRMPA